MPANLFSSPALLSGTVLVMLLAWLFCSAAMTLRVGMKDHQAEKTPAQSEPPGWPNDKEPAVQDDQPAPVNDEVVTPLGFTQGQRVGKHAGPKMAFLAASVDNG